MLGLCCCTDIALVAARRGYSLVKGLRLFVEAVSLFAEHGFLGPGASIVAASGVSSCSSQALDHRLNSCGTRLFHSMWDLPRSGTEPVSPALAGGFFTTELPGKPPP